MPTIMKPWLKTLLLPHLYTLLLLVLITLPHSVMLVLNDKAGLFEALSLPFFAAIALGARRHGRLARCVCFSEYPA